jgi:transcriptional regulator with XRE-family HTH domain
VSANTGYELDLDRLNDAIEAVKRHRGISARDVAKETGLSPSTLTRLSHGQKPDADALVSLLVWLQADVTRFARLRASDSQAQTTN